MQLLWPFRAGWFSWDIAPWFDPWILAILIAGLLLPQLFRLVSEEIGERRTWPSRPARGDGHARAAGRISRRARGSARPRDRTAAFARISRPRAALRGRISLDAHRPGIGAASSPPTTRSRKWRFPWDQARISIPTSVTHYKPQDSPALEAGQKTPAARRFLGYARFPLASVSRVEDGYRFELRDLRFPAGDTSPENMIVRVDFDSSLRVVREEIRFASSANP